MMKHLFPSILLIVALAWSASGFYVVHPGERGVVRFFGRASADLVEPGLHYHWPAPIEKVDRINTAEVRRQSVGFTIVDAAMGRTPDPTALHYLLGDRNIVSLEAIVQYTVPRPEDFLFRAIDPEALLESSAASALSGVCAEKDVDFVLTSGKAEIQTLARDRLQRLVDDYQLGIRIQNVSLQTVSPPMEVAEKFRDVVAAREEYNQKIQEARTYENRMRPESRGAAYRIEREAEAYRRTQIDRALGESDRFTSLVKAGRDHRDLTLQRLYFETLEEVMGKMNKIVGGEVVTIGIAESASGRR